MDGFKSLVEHIKAFGTVTAVYDDNDSPEICGFWIKHIRLPYPEVLLHRKHNERLKIMGSWLTVGQQKALFSTLCEIHLSCIARTTTHYLPYMLEAECSAPDLGDFAKTPSKSNAYPVIARYITTSCTDISFVGVNDIEFVTPSGVLVSLHRNGTMTVCSVVGPDDPHQKFLDMIDAEKSSMFLTFGILENYLCLKED